MLTLAAWLCTAGVTRSQPQANSWHRYSCVGLDVDLPDDWQAADDEPWRLFHKKSDGASIHFISWLPFSWSTYRVVEEWLKELPNPLPRTVKRLKVSGFEAVSLPADNTGGGTPIRDTWIGVPENTTGRGRVYRFMLMGAPILWESEARL